MINVSSLDQTVGRLQHEETSDQDHQSRECLDPQTDTVAERVVLRPEVDQLRKQDTQGGGELIQDVQGTPLLCGGQLVDVERSHLVHEPDSASQYEPSDVELG